MRRTTWRARPRPLYLTMGFAQGFTDTWFLAAVVWWVVDLDLSAFQLVLTGTVLEATVLVGEVPTGVVADRYSRKWSMVIAFAVMGTAMLFAPITSFFPVLLFWQALWGLGWTFQSGADTAWITDEEGSPDDSLVVHHAFWRSVGVAAGLPVVALLSVWSLRGAMSVMGVGTFLFGAALAAVMSERPRSEWSSHEDEEQGFIDTWRGGAAVIRSRRVLRGLIVATVLIAMADEAVDRLDVRRLVDLGLEEFDGSEATLFFGAIWFGMSLLNLPLMRFAQRRMDRALSSAELFRALVVLTLVAGIGVLGLAVSPLMSVAIIGWTMRDVAREVIEPLTVAAVNRHEESSVRATVLSFHGQAQSLGQFSGGLILGALAEVRTIPTALAVAAVLIVGATVPIVRSGALRHDTDPDLVRTG